MEAPDQGSLRRGETTEASEQTSVAALNRHILMPKLVGDQFPLKCFSNSVDLSFFFFSF